MVGVMVLCCRLMSSPNKLVDVLGLDVIYGC
jgi:hypothetical protein